MSTLVYITLVLIVFVVLISTAVYRIRARKLYANLDDMLELAMVGTLTETDFDESLHSALESKFYNYLSASETSANNVKEERARIKELISDISHQTKTPISNILLYTELLSEQELTEAGREYVQSLTAQTVKLRFLIDSLVKMSRLESGVFVLVPEYAPLAPMFENCGHSLPCRLSTKVCHSPFNRQTYQLFSMKNGRRKLLAIFWTTPSNIPHQASFRLMLWATNFSPAFRFPIQAWVYRRKNFPKSLPVSTVLRIYMTRRESVSDCTYPAKSSPKKAAILR